MGLISDKRQYRAYKARIAALPPSYRDTVAALERYVYHLGGIGDAAAILAMLGDLADLFEQGAAAGTPVRAIVGDDPVDFITTFLANYSAGRWITREEDRLRTAVAIAAGESSAPGRSAP